MFSIADFCVLVGNQGIYFRKVVPTELACVFSSSLTKLKLPCMPLNTLSHDLQYIAVSFAVQISSQNMYMDFHCVEISIQELHKVLHS